MTLSPFSGTSSGPDEREEPILSSGQGDLGVVVVILHNGGHRVAFSTINYGDTDRPVHPIIIERVAISEFEELCI